MEYFKKASDLGYQNWVTFYQQGRIYQWQGDLSRALDSFQQALKRAEGDKTQWGVLCCQYGIASMYYIRAEFSQALNIAEQSLHISENINDFYARPKILLLLVQIKLEINSLENAQQYSAALKLIADDKPEISQWSRFVQALILKQSKRARNRAKAENLLRQIIEEKII